MKWIKEHPYLTGGAVIGAIILYILISDRGSSGATVVSTGPSEAMQAANLQAQVQSQGAQLAYQASANQVGAALQAKQIDAATQQFVAERSAEVALTKLATDKAMTLAGFQTQLAAVQSSNEYAYRETESQIGGQVKIAGIQADVQKLQAQNALTAQLDVNKTQIKLADISSNLQQSLAQTDYYKSTNLASINLALQEHLAETSANRDITIAGFQKDVATKTLGVQQAKDWLDSYTQQQKNYYDFSVAQNYIDTSGAVSIYETNAQRDLLSQALENQGKVQQSLAQQLASGVFNKGGEGGANQVAVVGAITGFPFLDAPSQAAQASNASSTGRTISSVFSSITGMFKPVPSP